MKKIIFFLIFSFISFYAHTSEDAEPNSSIIDLKGIPNGIVGGHVNVITGNYRDGGMDLYTPGSNPIRLASSYSSGNTERGSLSFAWDLNLYGRVLEERDEEETTYWHTSNIGGAGYSWEYQSRDNYTIHEDTLKCGVTNCTNGKLTAWSRLSNNKLTFKKDYAYMQLSAFENLELLSNGWEMGVKKRYLLQKHSFPNQCYTAFTYGKKHRIETVTSKGKGGDTLGSMRFQYGRTPEKVRFLTVTADDGRSATYLFEYVKFSKYLTSKDRYVTEISSSCSPKRNFEYKYIDKYTPLQLIKSRLPEGRFTAIQYYDGYGKDRRKGRVSALLQPVGTDDTPIPVYKFQYNFNSKLKAVGGVTVVTDALGYKKDYAYSRRHRLRTINEYDKDNALYRSENLLWGAKGTQDYTLLKNRSLTNGYGKTLLSRSYEYDKRGNALKENLEGDLRGMGTWDRHTISYTYDNDLVASEDDGRKKILYVYHDKTELLHKKLIQVGEQIVERHFFGYNQNGAQIFEVIDDGCSTERSDLTAVTERVIKRIKPNGKGLPEVIHETYLNLSTGLEVPIRKTVLKYSPDGFLNRKEIFNQEGTESIVETFAYNSMGNLLSQTDPLGRTTLYAYDGNGNCTFKQTPNDTYYTVYTYDFSNRLIHEEEVHTNGNQLAKSYQYDLKGNRIASTDIYGNTTYHEYDPFGRVIRTIYPDGSSEKTGYDELNNPVEREDRNGHLTQVAFTALGKPYHFQYPDGSKEESTYSVDGLMESVVSTTGAITQFQYDYKGRKTEERKLTPYGKLLSKRSWKYNAFHLLEEVDPMGIVTRYTYDGAGRLIRKTSGDMEVRQVYDSFGRESETWELSSPGNYRKTIQVYNALNQVIEERIEDSSGTLFQKKTFSYDVDGNQTVISLSTTDGITSKTTEFDAFGQPIKIIHPNGKETHINYNYSTPVEEEIDPKGVITTRTKDCMGRISIEEIHSPIGDLLKRTHFEYDGMGHCIRRYEDVITNNTVQDRITTAFEYDCRGFETAVIEAFGRTEQKTTKRDYTPVGEISHLYKPDGTILTHTYDLLGRLIEVKDNVQSIHQHYTYDLNDNILSVYDSISQKTTIRHFDSQDRLIKEVLENGLEISYAYDPMGRTTKVTLPDQTTINYLYNAHQLESIQRNNKSYHYRYNLSGHLAGISLPDGNGEIQYTYDQAMRPIQVVSPYTTQTIPSDGYDACSNLLKIDLNDSLGEVCSTFEYDDLHQVTSEEGAASHEYAYDSRHNRTRKDDADYENDALNQLLKQGDTAYTYDPNGNRTTQTSPSKNFQCEYDSLDRLISLTKENTKVIYHYDPFHRRTEKAVYTLESNTWTETNRELYLYQGEQEIGTLDNLRILGPGISHDIGSAIALEIDQKTYIPLHDHRGNIISLIDSENNTAVETIRYSAFGEEQIYDASGNRTETSLTPWRFSSKRVDPETGWSFFGRRYYDPEVGRWTTPDPLWFEDGPNLYCYVHNRPLRFVDPRGFLGVDLYEFLPRKVKNLFPRMSIGMYDTVATFVNKWNPITRETPLSDEDSSRIYPIEGKKSNKIALTFINGINTTPEGARSHAQMISNMAGGCEVMGVYNQTHGLHFDLLECHLGLKHIDTDPVKNLHQLWDQCFEKLDKDGIIFHTCHSQGAIHTRNALETYDEEKRSRIRVLAIAPAVHIEKEICMMVQHYRSLLDFIPYLHIESLIKNMDTSFLLWPHPDSEIHDHGFDSPTYEDAIRDSILKAFNSQGLNI